MILVFSICVGFAGKNRGGIAMKTFKNVKQLFRQLFKHFFQRVSIAIKLQQR